MTRRLAMLCAMSVAAYVPVAAAQGVPGEDSLKLTHQTLMTAITSGNPAMLQSVISRRSLGFFRDSQIIVQLSGDYGPNEAIPSVMADLGRFTMSPYDTVYRVSGATGIVCMAAALQPKKGERTQPRFLRSTWVYAYLDGAWQLLSWHSSDVPLNK